jgi:hypothetical protein
MCRIQAVAITFFACTSVIWTTCIAWYIYRSVNVSSRADRPERYQLRFHIIAWTYSAISAGFVGTMDVEYSGMWCWIPDTRFVDELSKFLIFYSPLWLMWLLNIYWYAAASREINRLLKEVCSSITPPHNY